MEPDDEEAFTAFVDVAGGRLLAFARLLIGDPGDAEDALQVALMRVAGRWSRGIEAPEAYTRRALVNIARDRGRRRHLVPLLSRSGRLADVAEVAGPVAVEQRDAVEQLLGPLPPRQRMTVVLRVVEGFSEAETAALLGCSVGTVKSNLHRGLQRLRDAHAATADRPSDHAADPTEGAPA